LPKKIVERFLPFKIMTNLDRSRDKNKANIMGFFKARTRAKSLTDHSSHEESYEDSNSMRGFLGTFKR